MRATLRIENLLLASWRTDRESVARTLAPGLEPAEIEGEHLVSIVSFRCAGGRIGRLPVLPFSQLNVRVYTSWLGEPAVFFLDARVTPPGLAATLVGAPYRSAWLRLGDGRVDARGLGIRLRYLRDGEGHPGELGRHELGLFQSAGLRGFRIERGAARWESAVPVGPVRVDPLLALGFDVSPEPESLLYAGKTGFELDVPPRRIASSSSSGSSA